MPELRLPTPIEASSAVKQFGYPEALAVTEIFPGYFMDRTVFRATIPVNGVDKDRVIKVRKNDIKGQLEVEKIMSLVASYRFSGAHFDCVDTRVSGGSIAIDMPYLGRSLSVIGQDMDLEKYDGKVQSFNGFKPEEIEKLVKRLENDQLRFASKYRLIHGDLIQPHYAPNNVVYNAELGRLLLVDGEAITLSDDVSLCQFLDQLGSVREWMHANLLAA